jgi:hypothetical protein
MNIMPLCRACRYESNDQNDQNDIYQNDQNEICNDFGRFSLVILGLHTGRFL